MPPTGRSRSQQDGSGRKESFGSGAPARIAAVVVLLLCLTGLGIWWAGWLGAKEDPQLTAVKSLMGEMVAKYPPTEGPKNLLDAAARVGAMVTVMGRIQALPEELRPQAIEKGRSIMMKAMTARVDTYFATPPEKRQALIDKDLKQMESMRKAFEGGQQMLGGLAGNQAGAAGGNPMFAGGGGPGNRSEEERTKWRKSMIDQSSPQQRARSTEYFAEVERRRQALGGK